MSKFAPLGATAALLLAAGCASTDAGTAGSGGQAVRTIEVTLTDAGCEPSSISASAGPTTFHVSNADAARVSEFEVLQGSKIIGEVENVAPGLDRSFSLTLKAGSYDTKCPGATKETGTLEVADAGTGATADPAARDAAVASYLAYVAAESKLLVAAVQPFAAAVKAGDVAGAQSLFAAARHHYETIEPIAESLGDLDPAIDAREGDVPTEEWGGFHRLEKALWVDRSTSGMGPVADALVADVARLDATVASLQLEPAQIANGAVELLNEVSASKITGEEDRYSHTDLSDFAANLAGAEAAFAAVRPLLATSDAALAATIDARFAETSAALGLHRQPGAPANGYVTYDTLRAEQTKALSLSVDALAEPLSRVAALVLQ